MDYILFYGIDHHEMVFVPVHDTGQWNIFKLFKVDLGPNGFEPDGLGGIAKFEQVASLPRGF